MFDMSCKLYCMTLCRVEVCAIPVPIRFGLHVSLWSHFKTISSLCRDIPTQGSISTDLYLTGVSLALQALILTTIIVAMRKRSMFWYRTIPSTIWNFICNLHPMNPYCQILAFITGPIFMAIPQAATAFLIHSLDANDLMRENPGRTKSLLGFFTTHSSSNAPLSPPGALCCCGSSLFLSGNMLCLTCMV